ncbi:hypothetical protein SAMN02910340_01690 [Methanosarcina thermophila]|jgi:hypothetical protein|uniref:ATPase involved in DNA repair n=3 Tax=Methanosarcina thermophila TaxID=2210 RepID=A0A1I6ZVB5_METTE|nr:hypothetical protein [Methanosarcina thermophila]AKB12343.1 hypothetical protein MSTHT_0585 [Methanosarcina thermophila TM-1]AKB14453.1 hypothetical protein MSTHC_0135 [Methanosarcina thermophila CHTI-55]NLU57037.1 hypothetical protein [Methanosarcina thermophila]SFT66586.1 hypothetical protein SAMN02910340_01690 [Methanosarcina thermophila]BAW30039.1 conserved hypothetical protein [Methanosarcina thermophila]
MKTKFLSLLLILAGIIVISGCVDAENQHPAPRASEEFYRAIFCPYAGLLDREEPGMLGLHPHDTPPGEPHSRSVHKLRDAASLLDSNIQKAEIISVRLKSVIERYKAEGEDVTRLEALLEEYNLLVEEAKQYQALAAAAAADENNSSVKSSDGYNGSSEDMEREYLIRSQESMIEANYVLKNIFDEVQLLMPGSEELNSTSRLTAAGEGKAILMGSFTLNMHLEKGDMAIGDLSSDSEIDIEGDYTFEEKTDMHDKVLLYHVNSADVKVSGSHKTIMLINENITLTADGEGYAAFQGNGTYSVQDNEGAVRKEVWGRPLFEEEPGHGERSIEEENDIKEYGPDRKDNNTGRGPDRKAMAQ